MPRNTTGRPNVGTPQLDNYDLLELVGQGGMGSVYRARQISVDREVAVKVLARRLAKDQRFVERFLREARAAANLSHPNLIHIYDCGSCPPWHFFSMEFVAGRNLRETVEEDGPFDEASAIALMIPIADALRFAHSKYIIHRDVKPENIILSTEGKPKLADLGLAKPLHDDNRSEHESFDNTLANDADLTAAGVVLGTPRFMSPEQARRQAADARSDLYSLGATMFWLLTGTAPFSGKNARELINHHINTAPTPIRELAPQISSQTESLLLRLLAKNPDDRPCDASALISSLEKITVTPDLDAVQGHRHRAHRHVRSHSHAQHPSPFVPIAILIALFVIVGLAVVTKAGNTAPSTLQRPQDKQPTPEPSSATATEVRSTPPREDRSRLAQTGVVDQQEADRLDFDAGIQGRRADSSERGFDRLVREERQALDAQEYPQELLASIDEAYARHDFDGALTIIDMAPDDIPSLDILRQEVHNRAHNTIGELLRRRLRADDQHQLRDALDTTRSVRYRERDADLADRIVQIRDALQDIDPHHQEPQEEGWQNVATACTSLLLDGHKSAVRKRLAEAHQDPNLRDRAAVVESVVDALDAHAKHVQESLQKRIGQRLTIETWRGPLEGVIHAIDPKRGIALNMSSRDHETGVVSEAIIYLAWDQISAAEMNALSEAWPLHTAAQRIAKALLLMRQKRHAEARQLIVPLADHPLYHAIQARLSGSSTSGGN